MDRESSVTNCPNCGGQLKNFIMTNELSTGLPYGERVDRCQSCGTEWLIEDGEISLYRAPDEVIVPPPPDPYDYDELKSYQEIRDEERRQLDDEMTIFGKVGSWEDVRDKAVRLRLEGAVNILRLDRDVITATVQGDSGLYNVVLYRQDPTSLAISTWECDCFPPGTLVTMGDGTLKPIEKVKEGDTVRTYDGSEQRVTRAMFRQHDGELVGVRLQGFGETIWSTEEHPWFALEKEQIRCPECAKKGIEESPLKCTHTDKSGKFVDAKDLRTGMCLSLSVPKYEEKVPVFDLTEFCEGYVELGGKYVQAIKHSTEKQGRHSVSRSYTRRVGKAFKRFVELDKELAYLLGLYLGDGNLHNRGQVDWTFGFGEEHLARRVEEIVLDKFGVTASVYGPSSSTNTWRVSAYSCPMSKLFEKLCGSLSHKKKLSMELMELDPSIQLEIARGWYDADGGGSVNRSMVSQFQQILLRNGIESAIWVRTSEQQSNDFVGGSGQEYYYLTSRWDKTTIQSKGFIVDGRQWTQIASVDRREYRGLVYNLEVEGNHTYQVHGIDVHNCGWGEWAFKRQHTYVGRMCSHAYATMLEAQSQLMMGEGLPWQLQYASKLAVSGNDLKVGDIVTFSAKQWFPDSDEPVSAKVEWVYPGKNFVDVVVDEDTEDENVYLVDCDLITHVNGKAVFVAHRNLLAKAVRNAKSGQEVRDFYKEAKGKFLEGLKTADKNDYCAYREGGHCKYPAFRRVGEEWAEPVPADAWVTSEPGNEEYELAYWDRGKCPYPIWPMQRKCKWSRPRADFKGASFTEGDSVTFEYEDKTMRGFLVENLGGDTATVRVDGGLFSVPYAELSLDSTEEPLYTDELPLVEDDPDIPDNVDLETAPLLTRPVSSRSKRASLEFTATELYEIEEEGEDVLARNFYKLDLRGTHYENLE